TPFCMRKCNYCDFVSFPRAQYPVEFAAYPALLLQELNLWRQQADFSALTSIYFGGGTPSLLPPASIGALLQAYLTAVHHQGVNRLSMGAQSFDDQLLQAMGRGHRGADTVAAVAAARRGGFTNIGLDLIYGLPRQDLAGFLRDLDQALSLQPQHLSLYGLTIEEHTPWGDLAAAGQLPPVDEDTAADMLETAIARLKQAGYHHYEIANFALPGYESKHNQAYWKRDNYLGLGVSAASCCAAHRFSNVRELSAYRDALDEGQLPLGEEEYLTIEEILAEAMFLGLRLIDGIDLQDFAAQYGISPEKYFKHQLKRLFKNNLAVVENDRLKLTPKGVMLGNRAFMEFV
ncbi:MAG: radical SAM family heme chaperone HemW, partial [Clostridiales bacterium]